ncbi:MAG: HPt (histidine-containing phosphotransfer) domain-containing protein [Alphaproteobacteria bacterium]|jgi:HPt (histidine-containing phosphotransfer) domain-containing protein
MVLNKVTITALLDALGLEDTRLLISIYLKSTNEAIGELSTAVANADVKETAFWAHRIKGSSATLGFEDIQEVTKKIELLAACGSMDNIPEKAQQVPILFEEIQTTLKNNFPEYL